MRIAVTYGPMCLQRGVADTWNDPRTGSEVGWRRITEELRLLGHGVSPAVSVAHLCGMDAVVSINEPDSLRDREAKLRVCCFWLNEFSFCQPGFDDHVDLYLSPSEAHRQKAIGDWGAPKPEKWEVNYLGCDPDQFRPRDMKVPGRVVHCSSPDRGLHRLLEAWPRIKREVPHATLRIFYELQKWFDGFKATPFYPPIEVNRHRANYVQECLRRMSGPEWGIEVIGSVSRERLALELNMAEVYAYPCETLSWSEGFSCATLEACAAEACPVITDCDALGEVYASIAPVPSNELSGWAGQVVACLTNDRLRQQWNLRARAIGERLTWKAHAKRLETAILARL